jgi:hypothetical protein
VTTSRPAAPDLTIVPLTPERLDDLATLFDRPGDPKWCWCASFRVRRRGALLDAAIGHARAFGATTLEAYPADNGGERIPPPTAYMGMLSMFERAGFTVVARR